MVTFAQKASALGGLFPRSPDSLLLRFVPLTLTRFFVLDPTGGEPSDPMHPEPKIKVCTYA